MNTVGDKETENELPYNVNGHGKVFSQKALLDAMVDLALAAPNSLILSQDILHGLVSWLREQCILLKGMLRRVLV